MSAEKIAKEAMYYRAVEIACGLFVDAGYCVRNPDMCRRKVKDCESCIKNWLLYKARDEINSSMIRANLEEKRNGEKHNADG